MKIVCPTCSAVYSLAAARVPVRKTTVKCRRCGGDMAIDPNNQQPDEAVPTAVETQSDDRGGAVPGSAVTGAGERDEVLGDLRAFVGPRADRYLRIFKQFESAGGGRFALSWHWPAALVGFWWLLYRKLYGWAVVSLIIALIPGANLIAIIGLGLGANYLYYRHARKKIGVLRKMFPDANLLITLKYLGGVNRWALVTAIVVGGIGATGMLASIVMPLVGNG